MKKIIIYSLALVVVSSLVWAIHYAWVSFPIISGFGAKEMCSCMFVSGRSKTDMDTSEFAEIPYNLGKYEPDMKDSSVTGTVFGMAKKKAIYRKGIGCTLINEIAEEALKAQLFSIPPPPVINTDSMPWPYGDRIGDTVVAGVNKQRLKAAVDKAFEEPDINKKARTRAVVVVFNGQLAEEKYARGFNENMMMYGWSMAKSITSALTGVLVEEKKLDINKPAPVAEWSDAKDPRHTITIENLLQQTSGLNFEEVYTRASGATTMLYKKGDMAAYTATLELAHLPGTVFNYTGGNANIISRIIRQTVGEKDNAAYPFTGLFYKVGMYHTLLEPDASGTYVGSSYIMATARDYARFGLLYYNDGVWKGERILPEGWVAKTRTAPSSNKQKNYGYMFWLNGFSDDDPSKLDYPDVPADMFYCDGFTYQYIYIIPSKKLVVVRLGLTLDHSFDRNAFLKSIIDAVE